MNKLKSLRISKMIISAQGLFILMKGHIVLILIKEFLKNNPLLVASSWEETCLWEVRDPLTVENLLKKKLKNHPLKSMNVFKSTPKSCHNKINKSMIPILMFLESKKTLRLDKILRCNKRKLRWGKSLRKTRN